MSGTRAFTLVELLVAIGVVIILVSILLPAITGARNTARKATTLSLIRDICTALDHYGADYSEFPEDRNTNLKTRLETVQYRTFSARELSGSTIVDAFKKAIYYDEITRSTYTGWGGDSGPGSDPRGGSAKNKTYDIWSLGADGAANGGDNVTNWRQ